MNLWPGLGTSDTSPFGRLFYMIIALLVGVPQASYMTMYKVSFG
jgi:hypothetical protein